MGAFFLWNCANASMSLQSNTIKEFFATDVLLVGDRCYIFPCYMCKNVVPSHFILTWELLLINKSSRIVGWTNEKMIIKFWHEIKYATCIIKSLQKVFCQNCSTDLYVYFTFKNNKHIYFTVYSCINASTPVPYNYIIVKSIFW